MDIQGSKRDPVNSEKAWLDFAVRLLSREVVGKGKGQEAVWSERCKPQWWDKKVKLPWKNPTANPKDTKEVLLKKYIALEKHLREDDRFPEELEEEAKLWSEGKYKELFLQTSLVSLLGKVTGVHAAIIDVLTKAKKLKENVNQSLLSVIRQCLSSALEAVVTVNNSCSHKPTQRLDSGTENNEIIPKKQRKSEKCFLPSDIEKPVNCSGQMSLEHSLKITSTRRYKSRAPRPVKNYNLKLHPKPSVATENKNSSLTKMAGMNVQDQVTSQNPITSLNNITVISEMTSHLLEGNFIPFGQPVVCNKPLDAAQNILAESSFDIQDFTTISNSVKDQPSHTISEMETTHMGYDSVLSNYQPSHTVSERASLDASSDSDTPNCQPSHSFPEVDSTYAYYNSDVTNFQSFISLLSHDGCNNYHPEITETDLSSKVDCNLFNDSNFDSLIGFIKSPSQSEHSMASHKGTCSLEEEDGSAFLYRLLGEF